MASSTSAAAMPPMMYGTAWKKERTSDLIYTAIKAGFRGIDTAAMKRHYDEALAGEGIRRAISEGIVSRKDLFIQTKFTPQDTSSPYSLDDPIPAQLHASITSSLANLATPDHTPPYLDAYLLHSPFPTLSQTVEAWRELQSYLPSSSDPSRAGKILRLGISNVPSAQVLDALDSSSSSSSAGRSVSVVQNRFRAAERTWDREIRAWCSASTVSASSGGETPTPTATQYQGFWTLTGNPGVWQRAGFVRDVSEGAGVSPAAAWYVLLMEAGVVVLNGTTNEAHMREDLEARGKVEAWRGTEEGRVVWERCWGAFKALVDG